MRLSRKKNFRSFDSRTSRLALAAKARKRISQTVDRITRPAPGLLLKTIRVTDEVSLESFEVKIRQAPRLNQVTAETFGRVSKPIGMDRIMRRLRQRCVVRWLKD